MRVTPAILLSLFLVAPGCRELPPVTLPAENALGPYSAGVWAGDLIFLSGKIGTRGGSFEEEVDTCIDGIEHELGRVQLTLENVVSVTVYLTDMSRYGEFNDTYGRRFRAPHPARACVAVRELPGDARVEISVIAHGVRPRARRP